MPNWKLNINTAKPNLKEIIYFSIKFASANSLNMKVEKTKDKQIFLSFSIAAKLLSSVPLVSGEWSTFFRKKVSSRASYWQTLKG